MKIVKWTERTDGGFAWVIGDRTLAIVYAVDGVWRTRWHSELGTSQSRLTEEFQCAHEACLATEKYWPPEYFGGWLGSINGGYFRKFHSKRTVYVRKTDDGWYAVQTDGKLLGKGGKVSWFAAAVDACHAVEKEMYTPVDADPFVNTRDQWGWIKLRKTVGAA